MHRKKALTRQILWHSYWELLCIYTTNSNQFFTSIIITLTLVFEVIFTPLFHIAIYEFTTITKTIFTRNYIVLTPLLLWHLCLNYYEIRTGLLCICGLIISLVCYRYKNSFLVAIKVALIHKFCIAFYKFVP